MRGAPKLHEIASMIDRCYRNNKIDLIALQTMRNVIKTILIAQCSFEEREYIKQVHEYEAKHGIVSTVTTTAQTNRLIDTVDGHRVPTTAASNTTHSHNKNVTLPNGELKVSNQVIYFHDFCFVFYDMIFTVDCKWL